jgi:hypothetical protein
MNDPSLVLCMGFPAFAQDKVDCHRAMPKAANIGFRPLETAKGRHYFSHYILRRIVSEQELRFKQLIEMAAFVGYRIAITGQARKSGLSSLSTFPEVAQAMWPVAAMKSVKHRTSSAPETSRGTFNVKEMFGKYYGLIQEIAIEELSYACEARNVSRRGIEAHVLSINDLFRVLG